MSKNKVKLPTPPNTIKLLKCNTKLVEIVSIDDIIKEKEKFKNIHKKILQDTFKGSFKSYKKEHLPMVVNIKCFKNVGKELPVIEEDDSLIAINKLFITLGKNLSAL
jgi:hypothetical protein